eukprot:CAMPEP_0206403904 /NCGR_PEP_ID=MMETSP0294-20121207/28015_1 /ASSEMBLY_ACC=CAM_ASM_000327 /TAXON_ID=39354 /ORGANISM="Heterosigma akashiwo, Strain CCMP2393" /LENGTH=437 /DNA_ID=CAMNT_0053861629 /DNA_START=95 /DNA_END=1410 /DNA_ORIENTATION=+
MSFLSYSMLGDGAFLPENKAAPPIINTVLYFDQCPSRERVVDVVGKLYRDFERFGSRPVELGKKYYSWERVNVNPTDFVFNNEVSNEQDMQMMVEDLKSAELRNPGSLLWEVHRLANRHGQSAVVLRIHHTVGDGLALGSIMGVICTNAKGEITEPKQLKPPARARRRRHGPWRYAAAAWGVLTAPARPFDADTPFCPHPARQRVLVMSDRRTVFLPTLPVDEVKALGKSLGDKDGISKYSINDILYSVLSGAIERYNRAAAAPGPGRRVQGADARGAPAPAGRRPAPEELLDDGDLRGGAGPAGPAGAAAGVRAAMDALKAAPTVGVTLKLSAFLGDLLPRSITRKSVSDIFSRCSLVYSNVPGPQEPLNFAGEEIKGIQCIFPNLLPQVMALSYNGKIFQNMVVPHDDKFKDSDTFVAFYSDEYEELKKEAFITT